MQNNDDDAGDQHHPCQQRQLTPTDCYCLIAAPPAVPCGGTQDRHRPDHEMIITFKCLCQKQSAYILTTERIENCWNDRPDKYQQTTDPYAQRQPFKREATN